MARKAKENGEATVYTVNSPTGLNVRKTPDKDAKVLRVLAYGEAVEKAGDAPKGWIAVNGGYVMEKYLK